MTIFFTSDTHFGHKNIIKYCNRPFRDIDHMNEMLIKNWNDVVREEDQVYHLGDVSFSGQEETNRILRRLHGVIYHIQGNHDKKLKTDRFVWTKDYHFLQGVRVGDITDISKAVGIHLFHYPLQDFHGSGSTWHLHGHSHGNTPSPWPLMRADVGVDCWGYAPVSLQQLAKHFTMESHRNNYHLRATPYSTEESDRYKGKVA